MSAEPRRRDRGAAWRSNRPLATVPQTTSPSGAAGLVFGSVSRESAARHSVRPCHCTRGLVHSAPLPQNPAGLLPRWASGARHSKVDPEHHLGARFGRAPYGRQDRAAQGASISLRLNDGSLVPLQPTSFVSSSRNEVCALKQESSEPMCPCLRCSGFTAKDPRRQIEVPGADVPRHRQGVAAPRVGSALALAQLRSPLGRCWGS